MKRLKKLINREKIPNSKKLVVFSIFLFISSVLWFFNTLTNNYEDFIDINYKYINFPEGKGILGELPTKSKVEIQTNGFFLFKYKYFLETKNVLIDINKTSGNKNNKLIFSEKLVNLSLSKVLGNDVKIINDELSNKTFELSNLSSKKVEVIPNINISFEKQYKLSSEVKILPKKIKVSGYKGVIDTLSSVNTEYLDLSDLNRNINNYIKIKKDPNLRYSSDSVKISVSVEKFTEKHLKIPLKVINKPSSINVELFTKNVELVFNISIDEYSNIDESYFKAVLDYDKMIKTNTNKAKVRILNYPSSVKDLTFYPEEVEFLLRKK